MWRVVFLLVVTMLVLQNLQAQPGCVLQPPAITIHFGTGQNLNDINTAQASDYERVGSSCPTDGYYTYTDYTSDCFRGDWFTLAEDHTPGDAAGNFMLVNASPYSGVFFSTPLNGLKAGTTYEFAVWMMNVCRISDKCPFPLLPQISIRLLTPAGKVVAQFNTGALPRREEPHWTRYRAMFTTPAVETPLVVLMQDNAPGGCGNDFALDDITVRECVKTQPPATVIAKPAAPATKPPAATKPVVKKETPPLAKKTTAVGRIEKTGAQPTPAVPTIKQKPAFAAPPPLLAARSNPLIKEFQIEAGEIKVDLYDNGEIDGDTVSVYHNNQLLVSPARLSQTPITFRIAVDAQHPYHELVMVAHNLGSIPPNTSLMIVTAGAKRYQVFISSTEQKNAKVVFALKE